MRKVLLALGIGVGVLVGLILVRTLMFTADRAPLPPPEDVPVDVDAAVQRLAGAIRIPTVARAEPPQIDPATFDELHRYLRAQFPLAHTRLSTETVNRYSLLYTWKGRDPDLKPVLLMAHQDVVPVEADSMADWTHPPFGGVIADGFIWGRGTLDVKQGVVGILEAVEILLQAGFQPQRTVYLAFGHDEEVGGRDGARAIAGLLEARGVDIEFVVDEGGVLSQGIVPDVEGWVALIGVAEKGYVSLGLSAQGEGGHSSMPPPQTSVGILAQAVAALEANPFPPRMDGSRPFFRIVAPEMPFLKRMVFANLWLFEPVLRSILAQKPSTNATIRTTTAATMFKAGVKDNLLPTRAEAVVNFRIMPGETPQSVKDRVESVIADDRVTVDFYGKSAETPFGFDSQPPSRFSSTESRGFLLLSETIRQVAQDPGLIVAPYLVVGATDARHYSRVANDAYRFVFNRFRPDDLQRIHGTNERISVENYAETVRFYVLLIKRAAA